MTTAVIMFIGIRLPFSPLGPLVFGFTPLPPLYWPFLALTLLGHVSLTQAVKTWLFRKGWVAE